jgi:hypothetical protein
MMEFYVGILPEDRQKLLDFIEELKSDIKIKGEFDDPHGYYSFTLEGSINTYDYFIGKDFIKSLEHFWDDI